MPKLTCMHPQFACVHTGTHIGTHPSTNTWTFWVRSVQDPPRSRIPLQLHEYLVTLPVQLVSVLSLATPSPLNATLSSHTAFCLTKMKHVLCSRGFRSTVKLFFLQKLRFMCWITSMRLAPFAPVITIQVEQGHGARRNAQILCFLSRIHCCKLSNFHLFGD